MSWNTSQTGTTPDWIEVLASGTHPFRMRVNRLTSSSKLTNLTYVSSTNYQFKSGKTYQFVTDVYYYMNNLNPDSASFSISTPAELSTFGWDESLDYNKFKGTSPSILGTNIIW